MPNTNQRDTTAFCMQCLSLCLSERKNTDIIRHKASWDKTVLSVCLSLHERKLLLSTTQHRTRILWSSENEHQWHLVSESCLLLLFCLLQENSGQIKSRLMIHLSDELYDQSHSCSLYAPSQHWLVHKLISVYTDGCMRQINTDQYIHWLVYTTIIVCSKSTLISIYTKKYIHWLVYASNQYWLIYIYIYILISIYTD